MADEVVDYGYQPPDADTGDGGFQRAEDAGYQTQTIRLYVIRVTRVIGRFVVNPVGGRTGGQLRMAVTTARFVVPPLKARGVEIAVPAPMRAAFKVQNLIAPLITPTAPVPGAPTDWAPWPGRIIATAGIYEFRFKTPGPQKACLTKVVAILDVPDVVESFHDISIAAGGTRLPVTKTFRAITNVQATVVNASSGNQLLLVDVIDKNVTPGPLIRLRTVGGTAVAGVVDALVSGY